ncbi:uncharacterized protein LOC135163964 [Diachasmimorpha longicaudata]|uniref:uncharacterized protein LOC135163964 n=1 Tax=Diachasmimorpha longicaudata TaxID=58733 RepID=UPI0030B8F85F
MSCQLNLISYPPFSESYFYAAITIPWTLTMRRHWAVSVCLAGLLLAVYPNSIAAMQTDEVEGSGDDVDATDCPKVDPVNKTVLLAHESDCTKFYACSNGRKLLMQCALMDGIGNRLYFNVKLQVCDWPSSSGCTNKNTTEVPTEGSTTLVSTAGSTTENPTDRPTDGGATATSTESPTTIGNQTTPTTKAPGDPTTGLSTTGEPTTGRPTTEGTPGNSSETEIPTECPTVDSAEKTVFLAHESDCSKFYACSNGRKILMQCALLDGDGNRLYFNVKQQTCDWPSSSGCINKNTTDVPAEGTTPAPTEEPATTAKPTDDPIANSTTEGPITTGRTTNQPTEGTTDSAPTTTEESVVTGEPTDQPTTNIPSNSTSDSATGSTSNQPTTERTTDSGTDTIVTEEPTQEPITEVTVPSTTELSTTTGNPSQRPTTEVTTLPTTDSSPTTEGPGHNPSTDDGTDAGTESPTTGYRTESPAEGSTNSITDSSTTTKRSTDGLTTEAESPETSQSTDKATTGGPEQSTTEETTTEHWRTTEPITDGTTQFTTESTTFSTTEITTAGTGLGSTTELTERPATEESTTSESSTEGTTHISTEVPATTEGATKEPVTESTTEVTTEGSSTSEKFTDSDGTTNPSSEQPQTTEGHGDQTSTEGSAYPSTESPTGDSTTNSATTRPATSQEPTSESGTESTTHLSTEIPATTAEATQTPTTESTTQLTTEQSSTSEESTPTDGTTDVSSEWPETTEERGHESSTEGSTYPSTELPATTEQATPRPTTEGSTTDSSDQPGATDASTSIATTTEGSTTEYSSTARPSSPPTTLEPTIPDIDDLCPSSGSKNGQFYPHECSCDRYYICSEAGLVLHQCSEKTHFNPKSDGCDEPENAGCSGSPSAAQPSPAPAKAIATECPTGDSGSPVRIAHPTNCTLYYKCVEGEKISKSCEPGLHFNPGQQVCDWPESAGCIAREPAPLPPVTSTIPTSSDCPQDSNRTLIPHEISCSMFYICDKGQKKLASCVPGLEFNPNLRICDAPGSSGCRNSSDATKTQAAVIANDFYLRISDPGEALLEELNNFNHHGSSGSISHVPDDDTRGCIGKCPQRNPTEAVQLPHRDCNKFCKCNFTTPQVLKCPPSLYYNPVERVCDYPQSAGCKGHRVNQMFYLRLMLLLMDKADTINGINFGSNKQGRLYLEISQTPVIIKDLSRWLQSVRRISIVVTLFFDQKILHTILMNRYSSLTSYFFHKGPWSITICLALVLFEIYAEEFEVKSSSNCPNDNLWHAVPHEYDCTKYYICDGGKKILMLCGYGYGLETRLHFNKIIETCDWPTQAGCTNKDTTTITMSSSIMTTKHEEVTLHPNIQQLCPPDGSKNGTFYHHELSCEKYYICLNAMLIIQECSGGKHFNLESRTCEDPEKSDCSMSLITNESPLATEDNDSKDWSTSTAPSPQVPHTTRTESSSTEYCTSTSPTDSTQTSTEPSSGTPLISSTELSSTESSPIIPSTNPSQHQSTQASPGSSTPSSTEPSTRTDDPSLPPIDSTTSSSTESGTETPNVIPTECPKEDSDKPVRIRHPSNCSSYFECIKGEKVLKNCSEGFHFNPILQMCDWPDAAKCVHTTTACPDHGKIAIPHENDCSRYYACNNGKQLLQKCVPGLAFNQKLSICTWAKDIGCTTTTSDDARIWISSMRHQNRIVGDISGIVSTKIQSTSSILKTDKKHGNLSMERFCFHSDVLATDYYKKDKKFIRGPNSQRPVFFFWYDIKSFKEINVCSLYHFDKEINEFTSVIWYIEKQLCKRQLQAHSLACGTVRMSKYTYHLQFYHFCAIVRLPRLPHANLNAEYLRKFLRPSTIVKELLINDIFLLISGVLRHNDQKFWDNIKASNSEDVCHFTRVSRNAMKSYIVLIVVSALFSATAGKEDATKGCIGRCPAINPNNDVYLLPHTNCSQYCTCNYGTPFVMPCPPGLHFSTKDKTCDWPAQAKCKTARLINEPMVFLHDRRQDSPFAHSENSPCFGNCPATDIPHLILTLEHQECDKYCKCSRGVPSEHKCPLGFHFSPALATCTYPEQAQCPRWPPTQCPDTPKPTVTVTHTATASVTPTKTVTATQTLPITSTVTITHKPTTTIIPTVTVTHNPTTTIIPTVTVTHNPTTTITPTVTETHYPTTTITPTVTVTDSSTTTIIPTHTVTVSPPGTITVPPPIHGNGCIGKCMKDNPEDVEQLPHQLCSKFCKCDFKKPVVFECRRGLYYNPKKRICDYPEDAHCEGIKD